MQRKKPSLKSSAKQRRINALERLINQLLGKEKRPKLIHPYPGELHGVRPTSTIPLTEHDITRIEKEISILKSRI